MRQPLSKNCPKYCYLKADKNVYTNYEGRGGLVSVIRG